MIEYQQMYGKKIDHNPQWEGPLKISRRLTDRPFLISLGIYLVLWIGIAIYASANSDVSPAVGYGAGHVLINIPTGEISDEMKTIVGFSFLTVAFSLLYIVLLRWFTKLVVYLGIFVLCSLLFLAVCISFVAYTQYHNPYMQPYILSALVASIILFIITVILFIVLRKKINIACEVIKFSCKVVLFFPSSLLFPILPYILYGIVITFTIVTYIFLSSVNLFYSSPLGRLFHVVNGFGFVWLMCFITAFAQMVLSGSFATYYWTKNKINVPSHTILSFMGITTRYHLGTIAFGSLIIAVCKLIKSILNIKDDGRVGRCNIIACLCCGCYEFLFGNLERILRFINRNAYIMSCIHGTKFLHSAKDAFNLLMRNIIKVLVINKVTGAVLYLGQLLVVVVSALATYGYCIHYGQPSTIVTAIACVALSALAVTESFFMVLRIAIDTIFLCVLEDSERNDGSTERPYFMSPELKALFLQDCKNNSSNDQNAI